MRCEEFNWARNFGQTSFCPLPCSVWSKPFYRQKSSCPSYDRINRAQKFCLQGGCANHLHPSMSPIHFGDWSFGISIAYFLKMVSYPEALFLACFCGTISHLYHHRNWICGIKPSFWVMRAWTNQHHPNSHSFPWDSTPWARCLGTYSSSCELLKSWCHWGDCHYRIDPPFA